MAQVKLDPDNIDLTIICAHCRSGLWDMKILKRDGDRVVSSQFLPINDTIPQFNEHRLDCPLCGREWFKRLPNGEHQYRAVDRHTGQTLFI